MRALIVCLMLVAPPVLGDEWDEALKGCATLPPLRPVTVDYKVHQVPRAAVAKYCRLDRHPPGTRVAACTYPDSHDPGIWHVIVLNNAPSIEALECAIRYERAHMPPNNWGDPSAELPETMTGYNLSN